MRATLVRRQHHTHVVAFVLLLMMAATGGLWVTQKNSQASSCTIDSKLVNSCRAWFGTWTNDYGVSGVRNNVENHESRLGRQVDIVHTYHSTAQTTLTTDELYFASRPGTLLMVNWKPASPWAQGNGGNSTVNAQIDTMADSIKALGSTKIFLTIYHEPDNDVSSGSACMSGSGTQGTPTDYRAMWQNTRNRFDAKGVTNVVWVMNYMGYVTYDCMVQALWPGNSLVDWVMYDPYDIGTSDSWDNTVGRFYSVLTAQSDATHDFLSKPWGLAEFGVGGSTSQAHAYTYYQAAKASVDAGTYPKLKAYVIFDAIGSLNSRVGYSTANAVDAAEQVQYNLFANDSHFLDPVSTPTPTPIPTPTPTATHTPTPTPTPSGSSSSGSKTSSKSSTTKNATPVPTAKPIAGSTDKEKPSAPGALTASLITDTQMALSWKAAGDNVGVQGYRIYRDGLRIAEQSGTGYVDADLDSGTTYSYGVEAYDAAGNVSPRTEASFETLTVVAGSSTSDNGVVVTVTPPGTSVAVTINPGVRPVVGGTVKFGIVRSRGKVTVKVDGTEVSTDGRLDTTYLKNGVHKITLEAVGASGAKLTATREVMVSNHLNAWQVARNGLFAPFHGNKTLVNGSLILIGLVVLAGIGYGVVRMRLSRRLPQTVVTNLR